MNTAPPSSTAEDRVLLEGPDGGTKTAAFALVSVPTLTRWYGFLSLSVRGIYEPRLDGEHSTVTHIKYRLQRCEDHQTSLNEWRV